MPAFDYTFTVRATLAQVSALHRDPNVLQRLTPPPVIIAMHRADPLGEGSTAEFTLWFGPVPVRWTARHSQYDPVHGFLDTQVAGPMAKWEHKHSFSYETESITRVTEHIEYEHYPGLKGLISRLLFSRPSLLWTFWYRSRVMKQILEPKLLVASP